MSNVIQAILGVVLVFAAVFAACLGAWHWDINGRQSGASERLSWFFSGVFMGAILGLGIALI